MRPLDQYTYHPIAEQIVDILCRKTQNTNPMFFRILINYYLAKITAMMRVSILTQDRGKIPVNLYAVNLASSGQGKGHSTNIIEDQIINNFRSVFFEETYPIVSERNLAQLASKRAAITGDDDDEVLTAVTKEFKELGVLAFSFDSGTTAAVKQMRHKLLMAGIGSMNLEIDEIGSNLLSNSDVLSTFLELFDVGKIKQKLTKNTKDNVRSEEIEGGTPTNLLLFGTPSKLLNGGKTEEEFYSFLETGYARRCLFGYTKISCKENNLTPIQVYNLLTDTAVDNYLADLSIKLGRLAHELNYNKIITVSKDVSLLLIEYKLSCDKLVALLGEHEEIRKAELAHRYFKALKIAGTYAFIDEHSEITEDNLYHAIKLVETSGEAFISILNRERNYVKLAKYIASINREVTHVDLTEDLPFYKGSAVQKADLMQLAIAWGYKNQIIIKKSFSSGIEFLTGETLKPVDLNNLVLAYSANISDGYANISNPAPKWELLHKLIWSNNLNWITHHTTNGHRAEENIIPGFDMIVLDVDSGVTLSQVRLLLKEYTYLIHTTKRHTVTNNRFRIIMPINYHLALDAADFKEFMSNIYEWLPFEVDTQTGQRSRKWLTCSLGSYEYNNTSKLLDALPFIPKTVKNDERKKVSVSMQSMTNIEKWFIQNSDIGSRNNQLIRYALILVDMGHPVDYVRDRVCDLNNKLEDKLTIKELEDTIFVSVGRAVLKRNSKQ